MNSFLIHGCYDLHTLNTLKILGTKKLAFDLRGISPNLIVFKDLKLLLKSLSSEKIYLTFENDNQETILSFLNLLKDEHFEFNLIFRDSRPVEFYQKISTPFLWMFDPNADWKSILHLPFLKGVLLPLKLQQQFQRLPLLWESIDRRNIEVYLHANTFKEALELNLNEDVNISLDLSAEVEISYRKVDQDKLKKMHIWRRFNENSAGQ